MKRSGIVVLALIILSSVLSSGASGSTLKFQGTFANPPSSWLFLSNATMHIGWQIKPGTGQERMIVVLLRNGSVSKTLASDVSNKFANMGNAADNYWYNEVVWKPGSGDANCHFQVKVKTMDGSLSLTSAEFNIYPHLNYQKNGVYSYARLIYPLGGKTYLLHMNTDIKWEGNMTPSAWPSGKIHLKLMANDNGNIIHVGDIVDVTIDYSGCPITGQYSWKVGTLTNITHPEKKPNGTNGVKYRVRLTGEHSTYDSDDFLVGKFAVKKTPIAIK